MVLCRRVRCCCCCCYCVRCDMFFALVFNYRGSILTTWFVSAFLLKLQFFRDIFFSKYCSEKLELFKKRHSTLKVNPGSSRKYPGYKRAEDRAAAPPQEPCHYPRAHKTECVWSLSRPIAGHGRSQIAQWVSGVCSSC